MARWIRRALNAELARLRAGNVRLRGETPAVPDDVAEDPPAAAPVPGRVRQV